MDLTPLYDLRDRLKAGAVAGTRLIGEDFRLVRALETLLPLESASPVFAKIGQAVRALLDPACADKAVVLLDALSLCDAVLVTQGSVNISGPLEPLPLQTVGTAHTTAPYSVLNPLMEALTTSGGGRYGFVMETHAQQPQLFQDYRVKNALVAALGASYNELADQAETWLSADGPSILPLLVNGFDPKGKKEMVRRIHVIEAVSGAASNDFYLTLLETAEKEVRGAAVYALRHTEENAEQLVTLAKTEKGAAKKQAHWALARLESPIAWAYWEALSAKKPEQGADYMVLSTTARASGLVAQSIRQLLAPYEADPKAEIPKELPDKLQRLLNALPGKSGPEICAVFRQAAALGTALDRPAEGGKGPMLLQLSNYGEQITFSQAVPVMLNRTVFFNCTLELAALAKTLYEAHGLAYLTPCLTAALLTQNAKDAYEVGKGILNPPLSIFKKQEQKTLKTALSASLEHVFWDEAEKRQVLRMLFYDPATDRNAFIMRPLSAPLDVRWYQDMSQDGKIFNYEQVLIRLIRPGDESTCTLLGERFYHLATCTQENGKYLVPLKQLGWTKCEGLAVRRFENNKRIYGWNISSYVMAMPGSNAAKAEEVQRLVALAEAGKIGFTNGYGLEQLKQLVLTIKNADPIAL